MADVGHRLTPSLPTAGGTFGPASLFQGRPRPALKGRLPPCTLPLGWRGHSGVCSLPPRLCCSALPARGNPVTAHVRVGPPLSRSRARPPLPSHLQLPLREAGRLQVRLRCPGQSRRRPLLCCGPARLASDLESSFPRTLDPFLSLRREAGTPACPVTFSWGGCWGG